MKKRMMALLMVAAMGVMLAACGSGDSNKNPENSSKPEVTDNGNDAGTNTDGDSNSGTDTGKDNEGDTPESDGAAADSTQGMVDAILAKIEQPSLVDMTEDMVKDMYHLDPALLEQFTVKMPMMNIKTNEIAILKVKDAKDIAAVEEGIKQRAADVQKQFETYLQDQYENAKNYKLVVKDNYVLFVISEAADSIVNEFNALFE